MKILLSREAVEAIRSIKDEMPWEDPPEVSPGLCEVELGRDTIEELYKRSFKGENLDETILRLVALRRGPN